MSENIFIGRKAADCTSSPPFQPYSKVILWLDDENMFEAGDDTGRTLEADCPWSTQAIANNMIAAIKGFAYSPFEAQDVLLDPAAELGDGVTVNGVYGPLCSVETTFDQLCAASIAAPSDEEVNHEYQYLGRTQTTFDRKLAKTRSLITKTAEEIRLEVKNEVNGLSSSIDIKLGSITSDVTGLDGAVSTLQQTASSLQSQITSANGDISTLKQTATSLQSQITSANGDISTLEQTVSGIRLSVSNSTSSSTIELLVDGVAVSSKTIRFTGNVVFESDLADGTTVVSGDCIQTGQIEADYIKLGGEMEVYRTSSSNTLGGYIGYVKSYDYNGNRTSGMGMLDPDGNYQVVVTDAGARLTSPTAEVVAAVNITLQTTRAVNVEASSFNSDVDLTVSSDRRVKDDIQYDVSEKYLSIFERLKPASFLYKNHGQKKHLGFIAQDVETALIDAGLTYDDLAALNVDNPERYGIIYGEFIALLVAKIQQLEARLKTLEG